MPGRLHNHLTISIVFVLGGSLSIAGAAFMTLEDEMGFVNSVVWESVFKRYSVWLDP